jgi:phage terminase Nu1 subunit (DNA packaging protein)
MTSADKVGLTAVTVAVELGVTKQTVYNWLKNEGLPFVGTARGKIIGLRQLIDWHHSQAKREGVKAVKLGTQAEPAQPPESYEAALARKTRAEADLKELQLAEKRGEVASIDDVEKVLAASNVAMRPQIEAVPSHLATQLVGVPDRNTCPSAPHPRDVAAPDQSGDVWRRYGEGGHLHHLWRELGIVATFKIEQEALLTETLAKQRAEQKAIAGRFDLVGRGFDTRRAVWPDIDN